MIRTAPSPQTAPRKKSGEKFSAEIFSAEKFAVRIAEGGNAGGGPGGAEAPPGPSVVQCTKSLTYYIPYVLGLQIRLNQFRGTTPPLARETFLSANIFARRLLLVFQFKKM